MALTVDEYQEQLKAKRVINALNSADKSLTDAFHALQEASTEVKMRSMRIKLERMRNATRIQKLKVSNVTDKFLSDNDIDPELVNQN